MCSCADELYFFEKAMPAFQTYIYGNDGVNKGKYEYQESYPVIPFLSKTAGTEF